jgi:hypothetical protein
MSEPAIHLPHGHGKFPVWGWYLIGGLIVYLLIKRNSSVASMVVPGGGGSQALRSDVNPRQAEAEGLQLEQFKKQGAFQDAMNALTLQVRQAQAFAQSQEITDYENLSHALSTGGDYAKGWRCPGGGKPRKDPTSGRVVCMNTNQSKGFIGDVVAPPLFNFIQKAEEFYLNKVLPTPGAGSGGKVGTPPISGGGAPSGSRVPSGGGVIVDPDYTDPGLWNW